MYLRWVLSSVLALLLGTLVRGQTALPAQRPTQPPTVQPGQVAQPTGQPGQPAQPATQPVVGQTGPFPQPLYRMDNVSRSLNLTNLQTERLNRMTQQLQDHYRTELSSLGNLTPQERAARTQLMLQQYNNGWMTGARNVFNEQQQSRYRQLELQSGGFTAFTDAQVQRQLSLTNSQLQQLSAANQWNQQQLQNINRQAASDPNKGLVLYRDYQAQRQTRLNGVLTAQQQQLWQGMVGDPHNFPPSFLPAQR